MHERLEKLLLSLCIDAWPGILHHQSYIFIIQIEFNEDSPALWRVFDGVTDEVIEEPVKEETPKTVETPKKRGSKKAKTVAEKEAATEEITEVNE